MTGKKFDILIILLLALVGVLYADITKDVYIGRAAIAGAVYILPSVVYLGLRKKKNWKKIIVSTLLFGTVFGFFFEFIAEYNKAYSVVSLLFPFRLFGILPLDNILGHMMMTLLTIVFYEHFIDREVNHHISKNLFAALLPSIVVISSVIVIFLTNKSLLNMPYPYFFMGTVAILPPLFLGITQPKFIKNMVLTAIFFFFFYLIIEVIAVRNSWWIYPGNNYIGWVSLFNLRFPFEELFFWMMFYAASLVSYYELFIDDHRVQTIKSKLVRTGKNKHFFPH